VGEKTVKGWKNSGKILNIDYSASIAKFEIHLKEK